MPETTKAVQSIASLIISGEISILQGPPASLPPQQRNLEFIEGYIIAYYYAALTNVSCQAYLFPAEQLEENDVVRGILEASYKHFYILDSWFAGLDPDELRANPNSHLFREARDTWRPWVKDWSIFSSTGTKAAAGS